MTSLKNVWIAMIVVAIIAVIGVFTPTINSFSGVPSPTGPQHFQAESFLQGIGFGTRNQSGFDNAGNLFFTGTATESQGGVVSYGVQATGISTTTSACVISPPTATSTITSFSAIISSSSPQTTFWAFGTSTNPYATTSASSIAVQSNGASGVRPLSYAAKQNMFATTLDYLILYYTNGTTLGNAAQQQLETCSVVFTKL